jgi:BlaI family penicillinase repressor
MKRLPQISEAEFEVMKIIWKHAPISTNEITEKLVRTTAWSPKTVQTLIKRLVTKSALSYEKQGRVFVYTPLIKEDEFIGQKSRSFLERYFDGNITAMVSSYMEHDTLSDEELNQLREILGRHPDDAATDERGTRHD